MNDYKELILELRSKAENIRECNHDPWTADDYVKAANAIKQLAKERDAAVADLDMAVNGQETYPCRYCKNNREGCNCWNEDEGYANWEWRGVREDNDEID